jgi:short-subunit dehydrogenase
VADRGIDGGVVVVTGASSGIGREIARLVGPRARRLILVARRAGRLAELAEELEKKSPKLEVDVLLADLSKREDVTRLIAEIGEKAGDVDVLVNNAGVGDMGLFERASEEKLVSMLDLNVTSLMLLSRAFLPGMIARKKGGILNVSSGFGLAVLPGFAAYAATKHFVTGLTEALRSELRGTGVTVSQTCPGPVATEFEENIGNFTDQHAPGIVEISAVQCARAAVSGYDRGCAIVYPGLVYKLVMLVSLWTPRVIVRMVISVAGTLVRKKQLGAS